MATIAVTGVLLWGRKQTGTLLCLWSVAVILVSLASNVESTFSMPRYLAVIFPLFMILASPWSKPGAGSAMNSVTFVITVAVLSLLQAATFSLWTLGRHLKPGGRCRGHVHRPREPVQPVLSRHPAGRSPVGRRAFHAQIPCQGDRR